MEDNVAKIKERVDVVDLIGSYIKLQKSGVNFKARCPFHNEKSGSFFISPERQVWHCFGCGVGGDIFSFVEQIEGMEFPDALRLLAGRAGIELTRIDPKLKNTKNHLYEICERATKFFEKQLWESNSNTRVLQYLHERGVTDDSIRAFRLGYAPDSWQALGDFLSRNYSWQEIADAGLAIKKDRGGRGDSYYDRFRSRIMFPICDANGQVIGFSGRVFAAPAGLSARPSASAGAVAMAGSAPEHDVAKYVNTPQTQIYDKGRTLYGLHQAKLNIRRVNRCLAVEGNLDVVLSHQAGATHVVASCGTALTPDHLKIIRRYTDNLDLCFDADTAGLKAVERGVPLAIAAGFNVGIVAIQEAELKDPADYVKKYGEKWHDYALASRPFLDYFFADARQRFDINTALGKKQFSQKVLPFVASINNAIEQGHWINQVASLLKTREELIRQELVMYPRTVVPQASQSSVISSTGSPLKLEQRLDMIEEGLFSLLLKEPSLLAHVSVEQSRMLSEYGRGLLEQLRQVVQTEGSVEPARVINTLIQGQGQVLTTSLEFVYLRAQELWNGFTTTDLDKELQGFLGILKKRAITAQLESLQYDIRSAEQYQDKERLAHLLGEFSRISRELAP